MDREQRLYVLHYAASIVGGFFGGYAVFNHCDIFGNAQTANLIRMICRIFSGNLDGLIFLLLSAVVYIAGNVFYVVVKRAVRIDMRAVSIAMCAAAVLIIGLLPNIKNDYVALLPIFFVTPVLWNSFRTAGRYVTSPIFSTNNLRAATISTANYLLEKDKGELNSAKFYWLTLASFHIGVAMACALSLFFGTESIWFEFVNVAVLMSAYMWAVGYRYFKIKTRHTKRAALHH